MAVFDPAALEKLEADTQSRDFVRSLVETYLDMLTPRVDRVVAALAASDTDDALDAALSLRVSSIMTGAVELSEIATAIAEHLRAGDLSAARSESTLLGDSADRCSEALRRYLHELLGAGQESTDSVR